VLSRHEELRQGLHDLLAALDAEMEITLLELQKCVEQSLPSSAT
jgi:hypothetical protein